MELFHHCGVLAGWEPARRWRIIVAHNLPYPDARRTGKIPTLLLHRMVPNARYSIWFDGKLELLVDPYQILERRLVSPENMKLKELEGFVGGLDQFPHPKVELEQYPTGSYIASLMLFTAKNSFGDVSDKVVADFGCGCVQNMFSALTLIQNLLKLLRLMLRNLSWTWTLFSLMSWTWDGEVQLLIQL